MDARGISIGTKVELELFNDMGSKIGNTYKGEFMEILSDMEVIIFTAWQEPVPLSFSKSIRAKAFFVHQMHGPLNFNGTLIHKEKTKSGTKFHIKIDDDFKELQKRKYFRPDCFLKAEYRLVKYIDNDLIDEIPYKITKTQNISYTGACILLDEPEDILLNDLIDLKVWLKDNLSIKIRCKVIRFMEYEVKNKNKYQVGLSIEVLSEEDSELLIKYITRSTMTQSLFWGETPFNI